MKDIEYALKVMNSKIYGLRDAMVDNADVFRKFTKKVGEDIGLLRKRVTRLERRQDMDRLSIYLLIFKIWRMDKQLQEVDSNVRVKVKKSSPKLVDEKPKLEKIDAEDIGIECKNLSFE